MLHSPDERLDTDTEVTHHLPMFAVQIAAVAHCVFPSTQHWTVELKHFCNLNLLTDTFLLAKIDKNVSRLSDQCSLLRCCSAVLGVGGGSGDPGSRTPILGTDTPHSIAAPI